jgi:hypothetical protein
MDEWKVERRGHHWFVTADDGHVYWGGPDEERARMMATTPVVHEKLHRSESEIDRLKTSLLYGEDPGPFDSHEVARRAIALVAAVVDARRQMDPQPVMNYDEMDWAVNLILADSYFERINDEVEEMSPVFLRDLVRHLSAMTAGILVRVFSNSDEVLARLLDLVNET